MPPLSHRAGWVMVSPKVWLNDGLITIHNGTVIAAEPYSTASHRASTKVIDHGPGVFMPALVNAHTHVTLSVLHNRVKDHSSFLDWIQKLIQARLAVGDAEAMAAIQASAEDMHDRGIGLVGDFGPHWPTAQSLHRAGLAALVWKEYFGSDADPKPLPNGPGEVAFAYAGHAPNTAGPRLMSRLKKLDADLGRPFCLHLAESVEETEFLLTGKGPWADFLNYMGTDYSSWGCFGKRPVAAVKEAGLLDNNTLAVHLLQVTGAEIEVLARSGVRVCVCPRSNSILHGRLPDIKGFIAAGLVPALGTDSLASCDSLDMFDEMRFVSEHYPDLKADLILGMATRAGAVALGRPELADLTPGSRAKPIYLELEAKTWPQAADKLIRNRCPVKRLSEY